MIASSCSKTKGIKIEPEILTFKKIDTIQNLSLMKADTVIWNDNGIYRTVTLSKTDEVEDEIENNEQQKTTSTSCASNFTGVDRAVAKTSFATATSFAYGSFNAFRNTLQTDTYMRGLGITTSSNRASVENRNVKFSSAYLYAIKRESDNDFHMIIGDASLNALTNCEASGLPATGAASYNAISAVKNSVTTKLGTNLCSQSSYLIFNPAIHIVSFKGSTFFDIDHAAGTIGPTGYRPTTAWEIHPIQEVLF